MSHDWLESPGQVSVIIPVYNGAAVLGRCLRGIKASTVQGFELIVVDNGSTDDSIQIAEQFRAKVVHCPGPSGPGAARNMGVQSAQGDIVVFVDADVVIHSNALARLVEGFKGNPNVAAVFGSYDDTPFAQNFLSQYKNLLHHFVHQEGDPHASTFWAGCGAVRKDVFLKVGGFDQARYPHPSIEDIELGYRLCGAGYQLVLDKHIHAMHLKEWRLGSWLRADICFRAIPWSQLILESRGIVNTLNVKVSHRVSAGCTGISVLLVPMVFMTWYASVPLVILLGIVLLLDRKMYKFFLARKGVLFAVWVFPTHLLYYCYSATSFLVCWGWGRAILKKPPVSDRSIPG